MTTRTVSPAQSSDGWAHITLDRSAWYVRFYFWLWDADPSQINTCKLFWAYVFAPVALLIHAVAWPTIKVGDLLAKVFPKRAQDPATVFGTVEYEAASQQRRLKRSKREARLEKWSTRMGAFWSKLEPLVRWAGIIIGSILILAAVGALVYIIATNPLDLLLVLAIAAGALAVGAALFGIVWLVVEKTEFGSLLATLGKSFHRHTCAKIDVK